MKTRIHVNQHVLRANKQLPEGEPGEPPVTAKTYQGNAYAHEAVGCCPSCGEEAFRVVYRRHKPLSCGAVLWVETEGPVTPITWPQDRAA